MLKPQHYTLKKDEHRKKLNILNLMTSDGLDIVLVIFLLHISLVILHKKQRFS